MAAVRPVTHEQIIQRELQRIHPEIPVDQLHRCLEEHNYNARLVDEMLHPVGTHYGQPPDVSNTQGGTHTNMERHPSPSSQPRGIESPRPSRSVSADNTHSMGYYNRGMPDGHSVPSPRFYAEGPPVRQPRHPRSRTSDDGWEIVPHDVGSQAHQSLFVNTNFGGSQPNSPRVSPRYFNRGVWIDPKKETHRSEASLNLSRPDTSRPEPFEMVDRNLMTTQLLPPPLGQSTPLKESGSVSGEDSNVKTRYSPLFLPWDKINNEQKSPGATRRKTSKGGASGGDRHQDGGSFKPLDPARTDWSQAPPHTGPKSPPTVITSISSPVASPRISMEYPPVRTDKPTNPFAAWSMAEKQAESRGPTNNIGLQLKQKSHIQALLTHQKARYALMERRVREIRKETEAMREELAEMENDLSARRSQTPSLVATPDAISRLRDEKQRLQIDNEVLSRDIAYLLKQRAENASQGDFQFYRNMPQDNPYDARPFLQSSPRPNRTAEPVQTLQWRCKRCHFDNHQDLNECEVCLTPREYVPSPLVQDHS